MSLSARMGFLERIDGHVLSGWAVDPSALAAGATLILYVDDVAAATVTCKLARPDVAALGHPGDRAGFEVVIPDRYRDGRLHKLTVGFNDHSLLPFLGGNDVRSPTVTVRLEALRRLLGHVDGVRDGMIVGWAVWQSLAGTILDDPVTLEVSLAGVKIGMVVADRERADVAQHVGGNGRCGFQFDATKAREDGQEYLFEIGTPETNEYLNNSPFAYRKGQVATGPRYVSCSASLFANPSSFYDPASLFQELRAASGKAAFATDLGPVFPGYDYVRPEAHLLSPPGSGFSDEVARYYRAVNDRYHAAPPSHLVALQRVYVSDNRILHIDGDTVLTVYETARPPDRPFTDQTDWTAQDLRAAALKVAETGPLLYLGSAGFRNYGHFLIDDLPRIAAASRAAAHARTARVMVVAPGTDGKLNAAKIESVRMLEDASVEDGILFIPHNKPVYFETLYYVTPVSYHPHLKSPNAASYLRGRVAARPVAAARRLYVPRRVERGRAILNGDAVRDLLEARGYETLDVDDMSFAQQANTFRQANTVVGVMGAGMTNTVFCPPGSEIVYLAPEGWIEPFYWDLAAVSGHRYTALHGRSELTGPEPHMRNFTADLAQLTAALGPGGGR